MKISFRTTLQLTIVVAMLSCLVSSASAQTTPTTTPTTTPDPNGGISPGGVLIDADGVLRTVTNPDPNGNLTRAKNAAARANLDPKIAKKSPMRKVSLNRLEAAMKTRSEKNEKPTEDMQNLAGMYRVQYVFYYPETKDIVIAGPASGYAADLSGRVRSLENGMPTVMLDDLIVAMRTFFSDKSTDAPIVSVSIDPTKEGLKNYQKFINSVGNIRPNDTNRLVQGMQQSLGMQTVRVSGVHPKTHLAQVLVEADYRMKLIGLGLERTNAKIQTYSDRSKPGGSSNSLQRWYFVPDYECVRVAEDGNAMALEGDGVKLVSADELVAADGTRNKSGTVDMASKGFTKDFTKNYAAIASASPVFWQLRNGIDLLVAAAFIKEHKFDEQADWKMTTFLDEKEHAVETQNVPKLVDPVVASVWKGNHLILPNGGVRIEPVQALKSENIRKDEKGNVAKQRDSVNLQSLAADQWWWD